MRFVIANSAGKIVRTVECDAGQVACQALAGECIVQHNTADLDTHYLLDGQVEEIPARPGADHTWDGAAWVDVRTAADLAAAARIKRGALLAASDWAVLPDSPLSAPVRDAWVAYRQHLREMPALPGFPADAWPAPPGA